MSFYTINRLVKISLTRIAVFAILLGFQHDATAQHLDILFEYVDGKVALPSDEDGVATGNFPTSGLFEGFTDDPGFLSENISGLGIGSNDNVFYNVLDDLIFWDGTSFNTPTVGTQIAIEDTKGDDTFVTTSSGVQLGSATATNNFIQEASSSGDVHSHLEFTLEIDGTSNAPLFGSYGIMISLETDAAGVEASDPFFILFNYGLDSVQFDAGLLAFQELLSPTTLAGDFNDDGVVDAADFVVWRNHLSSPDESVINNAGDGLNGVDLEDYSLWVANYGNTSSSTSALTVPEPSSILMLLILSASTLAQRKN